MSIVLPSDKVFSKQWVASWVGILTGAALFSLSYVLFINPYNIIPGGVYGIGIILHNFFPDIQIGTFGLCLDIPLLMLGFKMFGAKFGMKTIVAALMLPLLMNLFTFLIGQNPKDMLGGHIDLSNDILLSSIFGGFLSGVGLGMIFKNRATSGGTDIVAMVLSKILRQPLSRSIIMVESVIVIIGLVVFADWKLPLYSIITIYVCVKMIDYIIEGGTNDKLVFIISDKHDKIKEYIINDMQRGGTYIKSSGMYTKEDKDMMFVVVSRRELSLVQAYVKEVDINAFMIVVNSHEILGDGFRSFNDKVINTW